MTVLLFLARPQLLFLPQSLQKQQKPFNCHFTLSNFTTTTTTTTTTKDSGLLFRQKLTYFTNLKINTNKALTLNPSLRSTPLSNLVSVEKCLSCMGLDRSAIGRIFDMYPSILTSDPYLHLYPVFDFLIHEVNIPFPRIGKSLSRFPRLLVSSVSLQLRPAFGFLKGLGFVGQHAIDARTVGLLVYDVERSLMGKIEFLVALGFEFGEVRNMVVRSPGILTLSVERNLGPKVVYFVKEMNGDLEELKRFPQFFSFSLERKIKPRHRMLVEYGLEMPLSSMLKIHDDEFVARLVEMRLRMVDKS